MEVVVRIAEEKYLKSGIVTNMVDATQRIMDDHIIPEFSKYNAQHWRDTIYWTEKCDDALKFYKVITFEFFH